MIKEINSAKIGLIQYQEKDIVVFPNGLFGFENFHQFLLIKNTGNDIFLFLQSIDEPALTFIVIDPKTVLPEYRLQVDEKSLVDLDIKHIWDFAIVTIPQNPKEMAMNLLGPIVIDIKNQIGKQVISLNPDHTTKHTILVDKEQKIAI